MKSLRFISKSPYFQHFFLGMCSVFGFAPFNLCFMFLFSFSWFFMKLVDENQTFQDSIICSFLFFLGLHMASLYWLAYPLTIDLARHWILIPFAIVLIPVYLSLQLLLAVFISRKYCRGIQETALAFSALFCVVIYFYGHYFPGFPWILPGYIWNCHEIFMQTLSIFGIYGLSFVTVLLTCLCGSVYVFHKQKDKKNAKKSAGFAVLIFFFLIIFGFFRLHFYKTEFTDRKIRVVQCNILQKDKINRNLSFQNLQKHVSCSRHSSKLDFIIWPEASIPYLYHEKFTQLHSHLKSPLKIGEHLIAGAVRRDLLTSKIYNSAVIVDYYGQNVCNYDKIRLVIFGEYIPLRECIPFQSIASDIGDFDRGDPAQVIEINGLKISMVICYEAAFPQEFGSNEKRADVLINLTNDGWFGPTTEPFQHLEIARARAVETGLPLIRAANYGISAVFDPRGVEIGRIPFNKSGFVECYIPRSMEETPYGKFGDTLFFFLVMICLMYSFGLRSTSTSYVKR